MTAPTTCIACYVHDVCVHGGVSSGDGAVAVVALGEDSAGDALEQLPGDDRMKALVVVPLS